MANHKTRQGVGIATRDTLSAIDKFLIEMEQKPPQPDEFTIQQLVDRNPSLSYSAMTGRVKVKVASGEITKRKICINGKPTNVFRYAK